MAFQQTKINRPELQREADIARMGIKYLQTYPEYTLAIRLVKRFNQFIDDHLSQHTPDFRFNSWADQAYRAVVSVLCGIPEACGRVTPPMHLQYLRIAKASGWESFSLCLAPPTPVVIPDELLQLYLETFRAIDKTIIELCEKRINTLD